MHIAVIGINHKQADLTLRELIAVVFHTHFSCEQPSSIDADCVVLSTCNRVELYFSAHNLAEVHQKILALLKKEIPFDFEQKLYTFFGIDCFRHLAKVTSGLDSAIIGETEIKGQVSTAYSAFHAAHRVNKELHYLFQKSLRISKKVRSEIVSHTHMSGLEELIFAQSCNFFHKTPQVLFVGASAINCKIAHYFAHKMDARLITFCTRTNSKAKSISRKMGTSWVLWEKLTCAAKDHELVITATKSPSYLLSQEIATENKKLLIDLAFPRNIDPEVTRLPQVSLLNIDCLHTKQEEAVPLFEAEERIENEATRFFEQYVSRRLVSA